MLLLFQSTHDVILAEKALRLEGIPRRVIPVPRSISSQCGMALEIAPEDAERAIELLDAAVFPGGSAQGKAHRYQTYTPTDEQ
jgi:hypothetical protein